MAQRMAYLEAVVGADITQFRKGMRDIRNETGVLSETMRGLAGVGRALTFTVTTPLLALGSAAVNTAGKFDASMRNINAIVGMSETELAALTQQTLDFGKATRSGAIESAGALYTVFSAGITDTADAFNIMEHSLKTAEAGLADLETTTEAMVATMLVWDDTSEAMGQRVSNNMTQMVAVGVGSMQEFASGIGQVLPAAKALGMSVEELYGNMAYLTQRGLNPSKAATRFNTALTSMAKRTDAMDAAFTKLGVGSINELMDKFGGFNSALKAIMGTSDGSMESLNELFGNKRGAAAIGLLTENTERWDAAMQEFNGNLDGATLRAYEQQMMSMEAQFGVMGSAIEGVAISLGTAIFPMIAPVISLITELANSFSDLDPKAMQLVVTFGAIVAGIGPLLWIFGSLLNPVGLLVAGVATLAGAFFTNFRGIRDTVLETVEGITGDLTPLANTISTFWTTLFPDDPEIVAVEDLFTFTGTVEDAFRATIAPTTNAISLWSYYEDEGFIDKVSWEDFMNIALEGGWQGGAIQVGEEIKLNFSGLDIGFDSGGYGEQLEPSMQETLFGQQNQIAMPANSPFLTRLADAIATIKEPMITALTGVLTSVGTWISEEGIGLLSYGIGYLAGSVGAMIATGINSALTFVMNALNGLDAGEAGSSLGENVGTPFMDGLNTALADNDVTDIGDQVMTSVAGMLGAAALANWVLFGSIGSSIMIAVKAGMMLMTPFFAVANLIYNGLFMAISGTGLMVGLGTLISGMISSAIAMAGAGISLVAGAGASILMGIANVIMPILLAPIFLPITIGLLVGIVIAKEFGQDIRDTVGNALAVATGSGDWDTVMRDFENSVYIALGMSEMVIEPQIKPELVLNDFDADSMYMALTMELEDLGYIYDVELGLKPFLHYDNDDELQETLTYFKSVLEGTIYEVDLKYMINGAEEVATPTPINIWENLLTGDGGLVVPTPEIDEEAIAEVVTNSMAVVSETVSGMAMAQEDPSAFIEEFLLPIETAWTGMYGTDGTMSVAYSGFVAGVATDSLSMSTSMTTAFNAGVTDANLFAVGMTSSMGFAVIALEKGTEAIKDFKAAIAGLETLSVAVDVSVTTGVSGGEPPSLAVGTSNVPRDMNANIHKGEMLIPKYDADLIRKGSVTAGMYSGGGGGNVTNNEVQINGVQDVDSLLIELERRGIYLE